MILRDQVRAAQIIYSLFVYANRLVNAAVAVFCDLYTNK
jgi:hypothetical protein